jgi:hypothetical protein
MSYNHQPGKKNCHGDSGWNFSTGSKSSTLVLLAETQRITRLKNNLKTAINITNTDTINIIKNTENTVTTQGIKNLVWHFCHTKFVFGKIKF